MFNKEILIDKFNYFDIVKIISDNSNSGQQERIEIIGLTGIIFGVTEQRKELKCYVFIPNLKDTYGIAGKNLINTNTKESIENYIPEFSKHYFCSMGYGFIYKIPKAKLFRYVQYCYDEDKVQYPIEALMKYCAYMKAHSTEVIENNLFKIRTSKETVLKAINLYESILLHDNTDQDRKLPLHLTMLKRTRFEYEKLTYKILYFFHDMRNFF